MSAIKGFLASQRADFISLHDLLEAMTKQGDGCTLAEAAAVLSQILKFEAFANPWVRYSTMGGITDFTRPRSGGPDPDELLSNVVSANAFEEDPYGIPF